MEIDLIKEHSQFLDIGLVGYQFVVPSLPFSSQLVNHQRRVSVHLELLDVEVNFCLDAQSECFVFSHVIGAVEPQSGRERYTLIVQRDQCCPNAMA